LRSNSGVVLLVPALDLVRQADCVTFNSCAAREMVPAVFQGQQGAQVAQFEDRGGH
jgi:hypothetical protein